MQKLENYIYIYISVFVCSRVREILYFTCIIEYLNTLSIILPRKTKCSSSSHGDTVNVAHFEVFKVFFFFKYSSPTTLYEINS